MLETNIYTIDWDKYIQWQLPVFLRKVKHWEWLRTLLFPLKYLNSQFNDFRIKTAYDISLSPQVIHLERMLNDSFDEVSRRIFIRDGDFFSGQYLYSYFESPNYVNDQNNPNYLYSNAEFDTPLDVHFIVVLPLGLDYNDIIMKSLINKFKAIGYTYKIIEE